MSEDTQANIPAGGYDRTGPITDPRIEITVVDQQQNRLMFAVKSRYPNLRTIVEDLSAKVTEDAALSLSITRDDGGYQFLIVDKSEAETPSIFEQDSTPTQDNDVLVLEQHTRIP
ncbi:hypothetical protein VTO58DRAFT_109284 [Aureobasidium pullulans]